VRVRRADFDAFVALGSSRPDNAAGDSSDLRNELAAELDAARATLENGGDAELAAALRSLARAASRLARAISRTDRD
jgi:hypothetical protein